MEDAIGLFFNTNEDAICTAQPTGCRFSATFIVDTAKLNHRDDIRADDLGVWKNCGVRSTYSSVTFNSNEHVRRVRKMSKPAVMRHSVYRLKRTYWQHSEDSLFCRRLLELEGTDFMLYNSCYGQDLDCTQAVMLGCQKLMVCFKCNYLVWGIQRGPKGMED